MLAGIGVAIFSQNAEPSMKNILEAVIVGAGSDVLANRGLGAYRSLTKPDAWNIPTLPEMRATCYVVGYLLPGSNLQYSFR